MTAIVDHPASGLIEAARGLGPLIQASADQAERDRQLPQPLVDGLIGAGLFRALVPRSLGGAEADAETLVQMLEEVSKVDGSTGWCVMAATTAGMYAGYLEESVAREVFGDPASNAALVVRPAHRAVAVDGGYRVSGRWQFASGCTHATTLIGHALIYDGDVPHLAASGTPDGRRMFFRRADCRIVDTWDVTGLCGTGSHEFVVEDVFVPDARTLPPHMKWDPSAQPGTLYQFGLGIVPASFAAVALGVARGAIDAFLELAAVKARRGGGGQIRDDPVDQLQVGRAEASLRSVRAFLLETIREVWAEVAANGPTTDAQQAILVLASAHAVAVSAEVVNLMWRAAGASAIFRQSALERRFRDIHVITQNGSVNATRYGQGGRLFLGLPPTPPPPPAPLVG
jgi:alkylation response protein AidB-like acyl-CoA dehydrogenase